MKNKYHPVNHLPLRVTIDAKCYKNLAFFLSIPIQQKNVGTTYIFTVKNTRSEKNLLNKIVLQFYDIALEKVETQQNKLRNLFNLFMLYSIHAPKKCCIAPMELL